MLETAYFIIEKIERNGYTALIVGGTPRDILLRKKPKDVDISTNAPISLLENLFSCHDIGKSKDFGIVTARVNGFDFEIAQFRKESSYSDGRRPDNVEVTSNFADDAARRDFTINAMGIDSKGNIADYFGGQTDLKNGIIRTVGNPYDRFEEDHLRMIRAIRFTSRLDFTLDIDTKEAIKENKMNILNIAPERIADELRKMASLEGKKFARSISLLDDTGILELILPEVSNLKNYLEPEEHHPEAYLRNGTPFDHTLEALKINESGDFLLNFAILFHDLGKGQTYNYDEEKKRHSFHSHDKYGEEPFLRISERLRLSNKEKDAILYVILNHMKMHKAFEMKPSKIIKLSNNENWELLKKVSYCDDACRLDRWDEDKFNKNIEKMENIKKNWKEKDHIKGNMIDGRRIMELTGLTPGPEIGRIKSTVYHWVVDENSSEEIDDLIIKAYSLYR